MTRDAAHALSFGKAAGDYEFGRPGYPAEAVEWMLDQLASGMPGSRVAEADVEAGSADARARTFVDVGAGTGKFTASLLGHGARVLAVEPDAQMRSRLTANLPEVKAVEGTGEKLPLGDSVADVVTFAQAWHWVDEKGASAEVARVLKPGGVLALIWNIRDDRTEWVARLSEIMGASGAEEYETASPAISPPLEISAYKEFFWHNPLSRDRFRAMITSRSYVIALSDHERTELLRRVDELLDGHPHLAGSAGYSMPYVTRVTLARVAPTRAELSEGSAL